MFPFLGFSVQTHTGVTAVISQPCLTVYVDPVRQMSLQYLFRSLNHSHVVHLLPDYTGFSSVNFWTVMTPQMAGLYYIGSKF